MALEEEHLVLSSAEQRISPAHENVIWTGEVILAFSHRTNRSLSSSSERVIRKSNTESLSEIHSDKLELQNLAHFAARKRLTSQHSESSRSHWIIRELTR
jgi:hypothetical protein